MKSVCCSGTYAPVVCVPSNRPWPVRPPVPMAIFDWSWLYPERWRFSLGLMKFVSRFYLVVVEHPEVDRGDRDRDAEQSEDHEVAARRPGHRQHREDDDHEDQVGPEVGLQHDQPDRRRRAMAERRRRAGGRRGHRGAARSTRRARGSGTSLAISPGWSWSGPRSKRACEPFDLGPDAEHARRASRSCCRSRRARAPELAVVDHRMIAIAAMPSTIATAWRFTK